MTSTVAAQMPSKNLFFLEGNVGLSLCKWLVSEFKQDLGLVVTNGAGPIQECIASAGVPHIIHSDESSTIASIENLGLRFDLGFLIWWPKIISPNLIKIPKRGFINTHPSLLPYNRGKHYNFWALVEEAPFGVSLHFVEEGVDSGDIVAQSAIYYNWEDTGKTLYESAQNEMIELFKSSYPSLRSGEYTRSAQDLSRGSFHLAKELEPASQIDLDRRYTARDLLNLLRARTFPGFPACSFEDDSGVVYEARIEIRRRMQ